MIPSLSTPLLCLKLKQGGGEMKYLMGRLAIWKNKLFGVS